MKNIIRFILALLISLTLITGFSSSNIKAQTQVVSVTTVNSNLFVITLLINGTIISITVDGAHRDLIEL